MGAFGGALACGSHDSTSGFTPKTDAGFTTDGGDVTGDDAGSGGEAGILFEAGSGGDDAGGGCVVAAGKFIYLVSDQNDLYSFDPPSGTVTKLGPLNCAGEMTPPDPDTGVGGVNSMAVDRHATAWVNFNDGKIFKVDTTSASLPCTDTGFKPGQSGFTPQLGMGFATASAGDHTETLYVSDNGGPGGVGTPGGGKGLGKIDVSTLKLTPIGGWSSPVTGYNAELTGTGDGKLFGFFTTTPSDLGQIDKATAAVSGVGPLKTINNSDGGYAFSFWGGDFWFYTAFPSTADPNATTTITHYVSATKNEAVIKKDIGYTIVGAGVSTCAPTVPPK